MLAKRLLMHEEMFKSLASGESAEHETKVAKDIYAKIK